MILDATGIILFINLSLYYVEINFSALVLGEIVPARKPAIPEAPWRGNRKARAHPLHRKDVPVGGFTEWI